MLNTKWRWRTKSKPLLADLPSTRCCGRLRLLDGSMRKYMVKKEEAEKRIAEFRKRFSAVLPEPDASPPPTLSGFAALLQRMIQVAAELALPSDIPLMFHPVSSFFYVDSSPMLTVTGIVCARQTAGEIAGSFGDWQFANLEWTDPRKIDLPILTTKERPNGP